VSNKNCASQSTAHTNTFIKNTRRADTEQPKRPLVNQ